MIRVWRAATCAQAATATATESNQLSNNLLGRGTVKQRPTQSGCPREQTTQQPHLMLKSTHTCKPHASKGALVELQSAHSSASQRTHKSAWVDHQGVADRGLEQALLHTPTGCEGWV
jgi:hypothetical protein